MASNKHVELRKTENFVRSKYYREDISKDKRKITDRRDLENEGFRKK